MITARLRALHPHVTFRERHRQGTVGPFVYGTIRRLYSRRMPDPRMQAEDDQYAQELKPGDRVVYYDDRMPRHPWHRDGQLPTRTATIVTVHDPRTLTLHLHTGAHPESPLSDEIVARASRHERLDPDATGTWQQVL